MCSRLRKANCLPPDCNWVHGKGCRRGELTAAEAAMAIQLAQQLASARQSQRTAVDKDTYIQQLKQLVAEKDAIIAQLKKQLGENVLAAHAPVAAFAPVAAPAPVAAKTGKIRYPVQFLTRDGMQRRLLVTAQNNELTFETALKYIDAIKADFAQTYARYMDVVTNAEGDENAKIKQLREKAYAAYQKLNGASDANTMLEFLTATAEMLSLVYATYKSASATPQEFAYADLVVLCSWYAVLLKMIPLHDIAAKMPGEAAVAFNQFVRKFTEAYLTNTLTQFVDAEQRKLAFRFSSFLDMDATKALLPRFKLLVPAYNTLMKLVAKYA